MAIVFTSAASDQPGFSSEQMVLDALKRGLSDEHFVYQRFSYVSHRQAREGEADFLVLHRTHGMLVLECKGYGVKRSGTGTWTRLDPDGGEHPLKRDPFDQAQQQVKELAAELRPRLEETFPNVNRFPFAYGHAVIFPMAQLGQVNLPLNTPREIVFDADDLDDLGARVRECMAFWGRFVNKPPPLLTQKEFRKFRRHILHPALELVPGLGAAIKADARTLQRLTDEQLVVVESWLDNPRLRVKGCAGSGKTVLALEAVRTIADRGQRVLMLCFNRALGDHLRATVESWELEDGQVQVSHFHRLCIQAFHSVDGQAPSFPTEREAAMRFWDDDAPMAILRALEADAIERFDAVVVDEGQDFAPVWWEVIQDLLKDRESGQLFMFYDPAQEIFGRELSVPEAPTFRLTRNLRNTQKIAEYVRELGQIESRPCDRCPVGTPPVIQQQESPSKTRRALDSLVNRLVHKDKILPEQIVVLTPHSRPNSTLADLTELGGQPLMDKPLERGGAVLHTTIGAFKGLESDVVIMVDIDPEDERCSRQALYVGASRARHLLFVFEKQS